MKTHTLNEKWYAKFEELWTAEIKKTMSRLTLEDYGKGIEFAKAGVGSFIKLKVFFYDFFFDLVLVFVAFK